MNLAEVMTEGSIRAIQYMLVNPSGEIKPNLELINTWDNEKRKCIHEALRTVINERYPVFIKEIKPLIDMPVFNNDAISAFYFCLAGFIMKRIEFHK